MALRPPSPFLDWPTRHPGWTLVALLLVTVALAPGLGRLSFSNDIRVFFSPDNPQLRAYEQVEGTFAPSNSVLFVVAPRDGGTVFRPEILRAVADLTTEAWRLPHSRRVDSLTNFQNTTAEGDNLLVADLVPDVEALTPAELARIRTVALAEPLLVRRLVSDDGTVAAVNVPVRLPGLKPLVEQPEVALAARALAAAIEKRHPAVDLRLTGVVMINQALSEEAGRDATTLVPLMLGFIAVAFAVLLRPWRSAVAALLVILVANLWAFAVAGWLRIQLSPPVISAFNMILTLAVADSVHLLNTYRVNLQRGLDRRAAMLDSLHSNVTSVFFTSFTTVLGFLSLNTSESPPFRDMGNIVAIGVTAAWILAQTLLPALMLVGREPAATAAPAAATGTASASAWAGRLAGWIDRRRWAIAIGSLGLTVAFGVIAFKNELNDEFLEYFHPEVEFRRDTAFTIERLTGFEFIEFALGTGQSYGIADPEYLRKLEAFAQWLRAQPKVRHVYAFSDIMKRLNRNLHGDDPAFYRLPDDREAAAQYLLLYEMSLPAGQELTDQVSLDRSSSLLRISLANITSNEMIALDRRAQEWLRANGLSPESAGTGQSIMFAYIGERNIRSLLIGTISALVLISGCMIFVTRSVRYGLVTLPPNLAPVALSFGLWYFADGRVGLAVSVVVGVTLGVVVDDTIHFVSKYLKLIREEKLDPVVAVRETLASAGGAMIATTVILAGGFGVLAFSSFELNQSMGILSAVTIVFALGFDLFVLPALLLLATPRAPSSTS